MIRPLTILLVVILGLAGNIGLAREYLGLEVVNLPFRIAGGKYIRLPVTDAGSVPAENRKVRIDEAGILMSAASDDPDWQFGVTDSDEPRLAWKFGFTAKSLRNLEYVKVHEVAPSDDAVSLVADLNPVLTDGYWSSKVAGVPIGTQTTPWLYKRKASIFVFRFTIKERNRKPFVLYQPAWFSAEAKALLRSRAEQAQSGAQ
jgi:hypothetical protein